MKQIETTKSGKNYKVINVGKFSDLMDYELPLMYQVDGEQISVSEGSIVRVDPAGKRALKNTGSENLTMMCIQYKANAFTEADSPMEDGVILQEELKW